MSLRENIETTAQPNSKKKVTKKRVTFKELWDNYKSIDDITHEPKEIDNYCAINLGEALIKSGVILKSKTKGGTYEGKMCWGCPTGVNNTHPLLAQQFADWLKKKPFAGCPDVIRLTGEEFRNELDERTGIIFFKDYWRRKGESGDTRTGDHIDLWDGRGVDKLASQGLGYNWLTNTLRISWEGFYSDKNKSKEVLFWEMK